MHCTWLIISLCSLFSSCLAAPSSTSLVQYIHSPSSQHVSLVSLTLSPNCSARTVSFTLIDNHFIFSSSSTSCLFVSATVYKPYIIAALSLLLLSPVFHLHLSVKCPMTLHFMSYVQMQESRHNRKQKSRASMRIVPLFQISDNWNKT